MVEYSYLLPPPVLGDSKLLQAIQVSEGFRAANHPAASANQKVTVNIPREKLQEWPPCFSYKLTSERLVHSK